MEPTTEAPVNRMWKITRWYDGNTIAEKEGASLLAVLVELVASRADLRGANLGGANLGGANLGGANLGGANLGGANLRGADLGGANLRGANLGGANLGGANLRGANLGGANLGGANLGGANLGGAKNARLPTGETFTEYLSETVPALLAAGGGNIADAPNHWKCHDWNNCPMAWAFGVTSIDQVPILHRPRALQFVQLFDAEQIPVPRLVGDKWTCEPEPAVIP